MREITAVLGVSGSAAQPSTNHHRVWSVLWRFSCLAIEMSPNPRFRPVGQDLRGNHHPISTPISNVPSGLSAEIFKRFLAKQNRLHAWDLENGGWPGCFGNGTDTKIRHSLYHTLIYTSLTCRGLLLIVLADIGLKPFGVNIVITLMLSLTPRYR